MPAFEFPADDLMIAYGVTLAELFENAAYGVVAHAGVTEGASPRYDVPVMAIGDTPEELLEDWLRQLRLRSRDAGLSLTSFVVDRIEEGGIQGSASGNRVVHRPRWAEWIVEVVVALPESFWVRLRTVPGGSDS
jgi:SHS2 domain-containing protein